MVMNDMTDDGKWGAAIRTDGQRPEWLSGRQTCQMYTGKIGHGGWCTWVDEKPIEPVEAWAWSHRSGEPNITQIRLPANHPHYQQTQTQAQTLTAQERLERMEALVRRMAALNPVTEVAMMHTQEFDDARALVAEMEPVVDGDLVEAREVCAEAAIRAGQASQADEYRNGKWDHGYSIDVAKLGLKRGRKLARGDVA